MSAGQFGSYIDGVVSHPQLEPEVKRAILASWASDAFAIRSRPALRRPPGARHLVAVRDVLDALARLDNAEPGHRNGSNDNSPEGADERRR